MALYKDKKILLVFPVRQQLSPSFRTCHKNSVDMAPSMAQAPSDDNYNEMMARFDRGKGSWITRPALVKLNFLLLMPLLASGATGYDGSMMNGLQSLPQWRTALGNPTGGILGLLNAIGYVGAIACLPFVSWLNETYGRKRAILAGLIMIALGTAMQAASQNFATFLAARFFIGTAAVFVAQPSPTLITELAYPTHRAKATSLYNTLYYIGAILAAWTTYGTFRLESSWSWRIPSLMQMFMPAGQFILYFFCPESPRWLFAHGRVEEARAILVKYHGDGDENSPLVAWELKEMADAIRAEKDAGRTSWKAMVDTPGARHRTFICVSLAFFSQWAGNGVVSYYFTLVLDTIGIKDAKTQTLINGIFQIFNFACAVAAALSVDKVGRRVLLLWSTIGMTVCFSVATALSGEFAKHGQKGVATGVLAFIFLFFFHYDIAFTPLVFAYPVEILPYAMRNKGMTVVWFSVCIAIIFNLFVNPIGLESIGWKFYSVYVALLFCMVLTVYFFYPETKGHSLEQIAKIFDKEVPHSEEYALEKSNTVEDQKYSTTVEHHEVV